MEPIIEVSNLCKTFKGDVEAVRDVSFTVGKGEFFAFLGLNGAGKSTTIKILTTLMQPDSGRVSIAGHDLLNHPGEIRMKIGVALQTTAVDPALTARELLVLQGRLFGYSGGRAAGRAAELIELVNLVEAADRCCGKYSGGMQRRLDLALALVHRPEILFLDEPTTGLDPVSRSGLWHEIKNLNRRYGTTVFLTTQYLDEADQVADRICIIDKGQVVALEERERLKRSFALTRVSLEFSGESEAGTAHSVLNGSSLTAETEGRRLNLYVRDSRETLPHVLSLISGAQLFPVDLAVTPPTLEDVFLHITRAQNTIKGENKAIC